MHVHVEIAEMAISSPIMGNLVQCTKKIASECVAAIRLSLEISPIHVHAW